MSMLLFWAPASAAKIAELLQNPETIEAFLDEADETDATGGVDKAWHGLHWLLTGSVGDGDPPNCYLMLGGADIGDIDVGYGPARALSPAEVANWHNSLSALSTDDLKSNYTPKQMDEDGVYPNGWSEEPEQGWAFLLDGFNTLKKGIGEVAASGNGLVIWLG